jgi:hypothetical protein
MRRRGMPNFYWYPDLPGCPSNQPVVSAPHLLTPTGAKWIEYGGTEEQMSKWLDVSKASDILPFRFNGKALGTWAICVGVEGGEDRIIRRPPSAASIPDDSKYHAA